MARIELEHFMLKQVERAPGIIVYIYFFLSENNIIAEIFLLQKRERGRMRVHHLNNVNKALQILEQNNVSNCSFYTTLC